MQAQFSEHTENETRLSPCNTQPPYPSEIIYPHAGDMIPTDLEKQKYCFVITNHSKGIVTSTSTMYQAHYIYPLSKLYINSTTKTFSLSFSILQARKLTE